MDKLKHFLENLRSIDDLKNGARITNLRKPIYSLPQIAQISRIIFFEL